MDMVAVDSPDKGVSDYYVWPVRSGQWSGPSNYSGIPKTGQTACYDTAGAIIPCTGTGQDGELRKGIAPPSPRFTDNVNSTVVDNLTGLIWTKDANAPGPISCSPATTKTWQGALDYIDCLNSNNYLGYADWRLPNQNELSSLIDWQNYYPALPTGHPFLNVQPNFYFTSSTRPNYTNAAGFVDMMSGYANGYINKFDYYPVWPVRSGYIQQKLTVTKTGIGSGSVSPNVGALNWIGSIGTTRINPGDTITLTATPVAGSTFSGWAGDCSGTGTCTLTMNAAKSVTATFAPNLINGVCGPAHGTLYIVTPATGLCSSGTATGVNGSGPWNWSCTGSGGGSTSSCSASRLASTTTPVPTSGQPAVNFAGFKDGTTYTVSRSEAGKPATPVYTGSSTNFTDPSTRKPNTIYQYTVTSDTDTSQTVILTIRTPLYNGWNVIAVPYNTTGIAATNFFASPVSSVYEWVPSGANMESETTQKGSYTTVTTLTPGKGYFVKASNSSTMLVYSGTSGSSASIALKPGWNMISNPSTTNKTDIGSNWKINGTLTLTQAINAGNIGGGIYWWNGTTYDSWSIIGNNPQIEPWKGYWIVNQTPNTYTLTIQ